MINMDWSSSIESYTCFEDLSNEIIYEIFEHLNFFDIYQIFSHLNYRYYCLIHHSTVPIKLVLPPMSYKIFQDFSKDFLIINQHRIYSIYSTNPFLFDLSPSPFRYLFQFLQLRTLILENFDSSKLLTILCQLIALSNLSSLIIKPFNNVSHKNHLYEQIFRLPALKYCQLSLRESWTTQSLSICNNRYSNIEHLILINSCEINNLLIILTYLPHLRRLSCHNFQQSINPPQNQYITQLNHLTHLSLRMYNITLINLESFFMKLSHQIQVFRLSTELTFDLTFASGQQMEIFIQTHLPKLRIFDFQLQINILNNPHFVLSINQFMTSFWLERKWFFRYEYDHRNALFYSIQPYRENLYTLNEKNYRETCPTSNVTIFSSVTCLQMYGDISIKRNSINFPNITQLELVNYSNRSLCSITMILDRVISLNKLTKFSLTSSHFCVSQLMDLLYFSVNIRYLILSSISLAKINLTQIRQSQTFQTIFKFNQINQVTLSDDSTLESIELFYYLCPRLEQLSVNVRRYYDIGIRYSLLDLIKSHHVPVLCLLQANSTWSSLFQRDISRNDECIKIIGTNLYLWS